MMKSSGLKNRFNKDELNSVWAFWYNCLWCGKHGADCFHHILSSSSPNYIKGGFNSSILNSCPIHNFGCHLYKAELHKTENEKMLLRKVTNILISQKYELKKIDLEFLDMYSKLYE